MNDVHEIVRNIGILGHGAVTVFLGAIAIFILIAPILLGVMVERDHGTDKATLAVLAGYAAYIFFGSITYILFG